MKSLINRRAAKAADSMWRRKGMFSTGNVRPEAPAHNERPARAEIKGSGDCPDYIPEKDSLYPLCDNQNCPDTYKCNLSAHMPGPYDEM